jgi:uncharacterized repeat protein (TIGR03803 family)
VISVGALTPILFASQAGDYATFKFQPHLLRHLADKEGALYGTTANGGSGVCNAIGCGTVFKLTPTKGQTVWNETVLYRFCPQLGCSDGSQPAAGLIADKEGTLYGTTQVGGTTGNGTVFKLTLYPEPK